MENLKKHLFSSSRSAAGNAETRSVFHIDSTDLDNLKKEVQQCFESVEEFRNAVRNLDGAGTHLTESLTKALRETRHHGVAEDCGATFREVYACEQTAFVARQLQDMSAVLVDLKVKMDDVTAENMTAEYAQTLCKVLLLFLRTQHAYHKLCSDKMLDLMKKLQTSKQVLNQADVTSQLLSLVLTNLETPNQNDCMERSDNNNSLFTSPKGSPKVKKAAKNPGSPKSLTKQTFKSSLFSLFERKPSPEEGKSAFYVDSEPSIAGCDGTRLDLARSAGNSGSEVNSHNPAESLDKAAIPQANLLGLDPSAQGQPRADGLPTVTITCQNQTLNHPVLQRGQSGDCQPLGQGRYHGAVGQGHVLADCMGQGACDISKGPGSTSPSNILPMLDPRGLHLPLGLPPQLAAGLMQQVEGQLATEEDLDCVINLLSGGTSSSSPMQAIPENHVPGQLTVPQLYRMPSPLSDSNIEDMKHPKFQMHRRSEGCLDLTGVRGSTWPHQHRSSLPAVQPLPPRQLVAEPPDLGAAFLPRYSQDAHLPFRSYAGQGTPGPVMPVSQWSFPGSSTWPSMQANAGSDTMNSSWSGVQDSSDLSDDSSSGEQFYAVGRDLVQANLNEDSSDDDGEKRRHAHRVAAAAAALDSHERSSVNTWPPKQQWSQSNLYLSSGLEPLEPADNLNPQHRPVQMQWSDPMSSRSMWPATQPLGLLPQRTSQSMQGFGTLQ